jgi:hypothetical protein
LFITEVLLPKNAFSEMLPDFQSVWAAVQQGKQTMRDRVAGSKDIERGP